VFLLRPIRAQARLHLSLSAALLDSRHRAGVDKPAAETADVHMTDAEPARAAPPPAAPRPPPAAAPARKEPVSEPMPDDGDEEEEDEGDSAARVEELRRIDEELAKADDRRAGPAPVAGRRPPAAPRAAAAAAARPATVMVQCCALRQSRGRAGSHNCGTELALLVVSACCHGCLKPGFSPVLAAPCAAL